MNVGGLPVHPERLSSPNGHGMVLWCRETTNDGALARGLLEGDEYRLEGQSFQGWAIDVGAHIGAISVALAVDNPDLQVVAIEPISSNAELIRLNAEVNGVGERVILLEGAAGKDGDHEASITTEWVGYDASLIDANYVFESRFVGNMLRESGTTIAVRSRSLRDILDAIPADRVSLLKIDCEGCEYRFLDTDAIGSVDVILGEYHDGGSWMDIVRMLVPTHGLERWSENDIGTFRATRIEQHFDVDGNVQEGRDGQFANGPVAG